MSNDDAGDVFRSRSREVVDSFLQTVVVLDDLVEMSSSLKGLSADSPSGTIETPEYPALPRPAGSAAAMDPQDVSLDAQVVIAGFADIGSVCAVLTPGPDVEFRERTVKAARRADIVILDWKIHESFGDTAMEVLQEILQHDRRRLRLLAIYTAQPDLHAIFNRIQSEIAEIYEDDELKTADGLRLSKGPLHVVVLAKKGAIGAHRPELRDQEVSESELARRLADEFALMAGGLLRNTAIAGIAAIRDNAHRILAKFEQSLDPAYLGHRLLLHHPPDAEDHILEALGSEVVSVLEEDHPGTHADVDAIELWLAMRKSEGLGLDDPFHFQGAQTPVEGWRHLLLQGFEAREEPPPVSASKKDLRRRSTEPFAEDATTAIQSNRRFAALLNLKTRYPGRPPKLSIGTLLSTQDGDKNQYFLCLQPKCDSVRLSGWSGFPLIPLIPLYDVAVGNEGTSLRLVLDTGKDEWQDFGIRLKPSELTVRCFKPDSDLPGEVVATEDDGEGFFFEDSDGTKYRWMSEMKDEHALGVAGEVASALARPGPNDAEWLRRASGTST